MGHGQVTTDSIKDARYRKGTCTRSLEESEFFNGRGYQEERGFR